LRITEGGRDWALAGGWAARVDADDREDVDGGGRILDFERVAIAAGRERG